jgi:hypothetical protein
MNFMKGCKANFRVRPQIVIAEMPNSSGVKRETFVKVLFYQNLCKGQHEPIGL